MFPLLATRGGVRRDIRADKVPGSMKRRRGGRKMRIRSRWHRSLQVTVAVVPVLCPAVICLAATGFLAA
jgi:hypothetical protein